MGAKDMQQTILQVKDLCKKYSAKADYAVQNVTFDCAAGEVVGILGHNGAGKSTTLKCLEGMIPFDKGEISVCGFDVKTQAVQAKSNMGFVTDDHAVFVNMTGLQYLEFMCDVYKVPAGERQNRLEQLQQIFDLGDSVYDVISSYSHGMKQKICMMGSLMHRPKLWILDEPMTGWIPSPCVRCCNLCAATFRTATPYCFPLTTSTWWRRCATEWLCCARANSC